MPTGEHDERAYFAARCGPASLFWPLPGRREGLLALHDQSGMLFGIDSCRCVRPVIRLDAPSNRGHEPGMPVVNMPPPA